MPHIYHFYRDDGQQPGEYVVLSEEIGPENAEEEFGEEGYELKTIELDVVGGFFTNLPTDRKLVPKFRRNPAASGVGGSWPTRPE